MSFLRCYLYYFILFVGVIIWYSLWRDGYEIFRDTTKLVYADNNAILPYRTYSYRVQACNSAGCVDSPEVNSNVGCASTMLKDFTKDIFKHYVGVKCPSFRSYIVSVVVKTLEI